MLICLSCSTVSVQGMARPWMNSKNGCLGRRAHTKDHSTRNLIELRTLVGDTVWALGSVITGFSDRSRSGSSMGGFPGFGDSSSSGFPGFAASGDRSSSGSMGGFDSLHDGLSDRLANLARNFQMEEDEDEDDEWEDDEFEFRPDVQFKRGSTYSLRVSSSLVCQYIARIIRVI